MCPTTLLMAHEEGDGVWPVASDMDAFLIGSRGMAFQRPLAEEQVRLFHWCLSQLEAVLQQPSPHDWTRRWLEVLKTSLPREGVPKIPPYGFGDALSYDLMAKVVEKMQFCGAVRHGAECFSAPPRAPRTILCPLATARPRVSTARAASLHLRALRVPVVPRRPTVASCGIRIAPHSTPARSPFHPPLRGDSVARSPEPLT